MSRLAKYEQRKAVFRLLFAFILTILLVVGAIYFLPQIILSTTAIINRFTGDKSELLDEKKDTIVPFPPKLESLPQATSEQNQTVSGSAEVDSTVTLYLNDEEISRTTADADGDFSFRILLSSGKNTVYTTATDPAGNTSSKSETKIITLKTEGPQLEVHAELDEDKGKVKIRGTTDTDVIVTVNERRVIVSRSGVFETEFNLADGENKYFVVAADSAGNKAEEELVVDYEREE